MVTFKEPPKPNAYRNNYQQSSAQPLLLSTVPASSPSAFNFAPSPEVVRSIQCRVSTVESVGALLGLSPYGHIALTPLESQSPLPLLVLTLIAAAVSVAALARFRSRDLSNA